MEKTTKGMAAAAEEMHKRDRVFRRASNFDFLLYLLTVVIIALSLRLFVFEFVQVVGPSMYPTLVNAEDMFVEKLTYTVSKPQRGDVIICRYPNKAENIVKRIVGLPGETISIVGGCVYINREQLDESTYWNDYILGDMAPVLIPEGYIFVMGDNRNESADSRMVGPLPFSKIFGKVQAVTFPFDVARWM